MDDHLAMDYLPLARKLAWKIAWLPEDVEDLIQEGMMQLIIAFRNNDPVRHPSSLAYYVLNGWMQDYYKPADRDGRFVQPPEDGWAPLRFHIQGGEEAFWTTYLNAYVNEMDRMLGPVESQIALNLAAPTEPVVDMAFAEMGDKTRRHQLGEKVRGYNTLVIKHEHIRAVMGLGESEWETKLRSVRSFTRDWIRSKNDSRTEPTSARGLIASLISAAA